MARVKVIQPGLDSIIEDLGRKGYYHIGIPPGGALDRLSFLAGNLLLNNHRNAPVLEIALLGPELEFSDKTYIVVTGADMAPIINGQKYPINEVLEVPAGGILKFDYLKNGTRAYLSVAGGFDIPEVLGSKSTYPLGSIGGFKGRKLQAGDELSTGQSSSAQLGRKLNEEFVIKLDSVQSIRVLTGLHDYKMTQESIDMFFSDVWRVSSEANRMGYRFKGKNTFKWEDIPQPFGAGSDPSNISDACYPVGSIQIPGGLEPIVLQRDAPSGGGFAMIGTVISCDMDVLGQLPPNHQTKFVKVDMDEALKARKEYNDKIARLEASLSN